LEKIFGTFSGNKRNKGDNNSREVQGLSDNSDNSRQLFSTLKDMETASRTRNVLGVRILETTWTTRDNFFKVPGGQLRPAESCGRDVKDKQDKRGQDCGRGEGGERRKGFEGGREEMAGERNSGLPPGRGLWQSGGIEKRAGNHALFPPHGELSKPSEYQPRQQIFSELLNDASAENVPLFPPSFT
jgi:hypothetical protein